VTGGTYTLVIALPQTARIEVGALGEITFRPGWYAYAGSANGPGGFARIDRHRELAAGERDVSHWHIDYLLGHPDASVDAVERTAGVDGECTIAASVAGDPVPAFGCSDCGCDSHLFYDSSREALLASVRDSHRSVREGTQKATSVGDPTSSGD
jgi:Uri superfamily endonuclease